MKKKSNKKIKIRKVWKMNPVVRVKLSDKLYNRNREKIKILKILRKEE